MPLQGEPASRREDALVGAFCRGTHTADAWPPCVAAGSFG